MAQGRVNGTGESPAPSRTWVEVDLRALRHNARAIMDQVGDAAFMAVVKADAYGHGAVQVARAVSREGAEYLAVASVEEGLELRRSGIQLPILILGWTPPEAFPMVVAHDLTQAVFRLDDARALAQAADRADRQAKIHIKLDTGMGRLGLPLLVGAEDLDKALAVVEAAAGLPALDIEGIFTHFACADEPGEGTTQVQLERFNAFLAACRRSGITFRYRHAANSAAIWRFGGAHFTMVRAGISLYGYSPSRHVEPTDVLQPALAWFARVAQVKTVPSGTGISYGHRYRTSSRQRLATITAGYADGYPRALWEDAHVLLDGRRLPVVGRICMDLFMVVLPAELEVNPGDAVILLGSSGGHRLTADDLAQRLDTISYEVLAGIGKRVPRLYVGNQSPAT